MLLTLHSYLFMSGVIFLLTLAIFPSVESKRPPASSKDGKGKKKVVIIGEMSDLAFEMATNASASTNYALDDVTFADGDYDDHDSSSLHDRPPVSRHHYQRYRGSSRRPIPLRVGSEWGKKRIPHPMVTYDGRNHIRHPPPGSMFVPVAAYSVTHSRIGGAGGGTRRMRPGKTTESAVYGYVQKPEIVEFRGQYFYGPHSSPPLPPPPPPPSYHRDHYSSEAASYHEPHVVSYKDYGYKELVPRISTKQQNNQGSGGIGAGGLMLATLPLLLAPLLSYLFTPMVIPVTATIAAGRRRRKRDIGWTGGGGREARLAKKELEIPAILLLHRGHHRVNSSKRNCE